MRPVRPFAAEKVRAPREFSPPRLPPGVPLDVEIGCGVGWHPIRYAQENPGRFLVAIERTRTRFSAFERRLQRHRSRGAELSNLMAVHADAVAWVTYALAPRSVDRVLLFYPNPYPKVSDQNLRWHAMPFMHHLLDVLKQDGEIRLATNELFYFEEATRYLSEIWKLEMNESFQFSASQSPFAAPRTHFEKKYLARGETCYEARWRKKPL